MPTHCPYTLESLLDLREGRLAPEAADRLRAHLAGGCADCAVGLRWLEDTLPALESAFGESAAPEPSPGAVAYAQSLARLLRPEAPPAARRLARFVATLVSGGERPLAPLGVRGAAAAGPVQRVYVTDAHLITLWDEPDDDGTGRYLIGQVYARAGEEDEAGAALTPHRAALLLADGAEREAMREGSEFHLDGVSTGTYLVRCLLRTPAGDEEEVLLPGVAVGGG